MEVAHHGTGKAVIIRIVGNLAPVHPFGAGELLVVEVHVARSVELCEIAYEQGRRPWPGLVAEIADVLYAHAGFFENLALNGLLEALANFGETGDERPVRKPATCVFREE